MASLVQFPPPLSGEGSGLMMRCKEMLLPPARMRSQRVKNHLLAPKHRSFKPFHQIFQTETPQPKSHVQSCPKPEVCMSPRFRSPQLRRILGRFIHDMFNPKYPERQGAFTQTLLVSTQSLETKPNPNLAKPSCTRLIIQLSPKIPDDSRTPLPELWTSNRKESALRDYR